MKRLVLPLLLLATPAIAQQAPTPTQRATEIMLNREILAHQSDLAAAVQAENQVNQLEAQLKTVTAERDKLKAEAAHPCPPEHQVITTDSSGKQANGCLPNDGKPAVIGDGAHLTK